MSHLTDLAAQVTEAEDAFARGDIAAGHRAHQLASTLAREANRAATRLAVAVDHAEMDAAFAKERRR